MNRFTLSALVALASISPAFAQSLGTPEYLGQIVLPTGLKLAGVEFGGISGLDYDAANDQFYAISDDRSQKAPARFYVLKLTADDKGVSALDIVASHELTGADGKAFAEGGVDPEAIRFDAANGKLHWSSEGDADGKPAIFEAGLDGKFTRNLNVPVYYAPNADKTAGVYGNLAFEGLALSTDGQTLWASTENALAQDGDKATLEAGSPSRLISFDLATGEPKAEYVYETGKIFTKATAEPPYNDNGLAEILTLDDTHLLAVERSFAAGIGNEINLYVVDLAGATDVKGAETIKGMTVTPVKKEHVLKLGEGDFGLDIDNVEAASFGPEIGGKRTLVLASDNNFNPIGQFTQFVVFTLAN